MSTVPRMLRASPRRDTPGSLALVGQIFQVLNLVRIGLALHAVAVNIQRGPLATHPGVLAGAVIVIIAWTSFVGIGYARPGGRSRLWYAADVLMAVVMTVSSEWILGPVLYDRDFLSVPVFWSVCAPLALAIGVSMRAGVLAAVLVGGAKVIVTPTLEPGLWSTLVILVLVCAGVGLLVDFLLSNLTERDRAFAEAAALAERERLNRIVHDGVLQVLALVEREGPGLGPRGHRLAGLAHEQEVKLRTLLQDRSVEVRRFDAGERRDLTALLDRHASATVTISTMADEVLVDSDVADEIDAVVSEILSNVAKHAGPGAQAWLLLEQEGNEVILSVRDNGVGTTTEQLSQAFHGGHLGVRNSILGRVRDLGGHANVRTSVGRGVEWELRIPVT